MPRYELSLSNGEKILIDHAAPGMAELLPEVEGKTFLLLKEITGASTGAARDVIVISSQITLIRSLVEGSTQSSNFRPKR